MAVLFFDIHIVKVDPEKFFEKLYTRSLARTVIAKLSQLGLEELDISVEALR